MSVIAWDGKLMAADRQGTYSNLCRTGRKIYRIDDNHVVAFCGNISTSLHLLDWYKKGLDKKTWPDKLQHSENWCSMIVAEDGIIRFMDREPYFIEVEDPFMAWGVGADFAIGAMEMGANAIRAVEIAIKWSEGCGKGVDWFQIEN